MSIRIIIRVLVGVDAAGGAYGSQTALALDSEFSCG